ncbi:aminotransferase class III-fold pyridoxal phosphate-dependent enzyme, partial [Pseudomonas viridiflava]|uniref:aminotransferase class III-fold pyridoxal phosphate-dependent enzyme n=1 Tax=Pseudomonas viridiflava TaxID=33069 RepID=UPI001F12CDD1
FTQFIEDVESGVSRPAAVILEAVQGEGGVNPAPDSWLRQIREVTRKHGILLILDEVQAGFGRTGKMFAFEHAGIEPDIIVMSKAVGGGLPLAVLGIRREFDVFDELGEVVAQRFGSGFATEAQRATVFVRVRQKLHT